MPEALVTAVAVAFPLNRAVAPEGGALNVTVTPARGFDEASTTRACKADANDAPKATLCGVPPAAATDAATATFVNANWAGARPDTAAVTL